MDGWVDGVRAWGGWVWMGGWGESLGRVGLDGWSFQLLLNFDQLFLFFLFFFQLPFGQFLFFTFSNSY